MTSVGAVRVPLSRKQCRQCGRHYRPAGPLLACGGPRFWQIEHQCCRLCRTKTSGLLHLGTMRAASRARPAAHAHCQLLLTCKHCDRAEVGQAAEVTGKRLAIDLQDEPKHLFKVINLHSSCLVAQHMVVNCRSRLWVTPALVSCYHSYNLLNLTRSDPTSAVAGCAGYISRAILLFTGGSLWYRHQ